APDGVSIQIVDSENRSIAVAENTSGGATTAADLGIKTTTPQTGTLAGTRILSGMNTTLARTLNGGSGIAGDGAIPVTGRDALVTVDANIKTFDDLIRNINSKGTRIHARINDHGDGILLYEDAAGTGASKIKVANETGSVGSNLNLVGEATGTGTVNFLDGSFEKKVTFDPADSLQTMASKITAAGV